MSEFGGERRRQAARRLHHLLEVVVARCRGVGAKKGKAQRIGQASLSKCACSPIAWTHGDTTAGIGKSFAIGSASLTSLAPCENRKVDIQNSRGSRAALRGGDALRLRSRDHEVRGGLSTFVAGLRLGVEHAAGHP